jgi:hypothetical protein
LHWAVVVGVVVAIVIVGTIFVFVLPMVWPGAPWGHSAKNDLVGTWSGINSGHVETLTLNQDGTFAQMLAGIPDEPDARTHEGRWSCGSGKLSFDNYLIVETRPAGRQYRLVSDYEFTVVKVPFFGSASVYNEDESLARKRE